MKVELITRKEIPTLFGKVELMSYEYKTMTALYYFGYSKSGHLIGYARTLEAITKRMKRDK